MFAVPDQADLDSWESNNTLPTKKKSKVQYYRDNKNLPLYGTKNPDVKEIFQICLLEDIPEEKCVKEKPLRIKHTSTFVIKQDFINLKHPYDLEADDTPGVFKKHDKVRFYEAKQTDEAELFLSSEVHGTKNRNGQVIGGTYNRRTNEGWKAKVAKKDSLYTVIRKRGAHQATRLHYGNALVRHITFVMPVDEYNRIHGGTLKSIKEYKLILNTIIMHYSFNMEEIPIIPVKHGNAK